MTVANFKKWGKNISDGTNFSRVILNDTNGTFFVSWANSSDGNTWQD